MRRTSYRGPGRASRHYGPGSGSRGAPPLAGVGTALVRLGVAVVVLAVLAGIFVAVQLLRGEPSAQASVVLPASSVVPGSPPSMPWPALGAADVEIEGIANLGGVNVGEVRPLASVTKLLTALVMLKDHPLSVGQQGPSLTVSAAEAAAYPGELAKFESLVPVQAGEQLTELQALEAMLVPSADNVADIVAAWDAGSIPAFVAKVNAEAAALHLDHTHLADASGLDPNSEGTAADMVRLAGYVMANPVLRQVVAMPQVTLPVAGTVYNYDSVLGKDGIVGIKTGSTVQAGGNFVFAAQRNVGGRQVTVLGAVLGATGTQPLASALTDARALASAAFGQLKEVTVLPAGRTVVRVTSPWGASTTATTTQAVSFLTVPGQAVQLGVQRLAAIDGPALHQLPAGRRVAVVTVRVGTQSATVPAATVGAVSAPSLSYRLSRL